MQTKNKENKQTNKRFPLVKFINQSKCSSILSSFYEETSVLFLDLENCFS